MTSKWIRLDQSINELKEFYKTAMVLNKHSQLEPNCQQINLRFEKQLESVHRKLESAIKIQSFYRGCMAR